VATCGVIDLWVLPSASNIWLHVVALCGRLALRGIWGLHLLLTTNCSWAESYWFQSAVGAVIALNAVVMGFETDIDMPIFEWFDQALLSLFVAELFIRLRNQGRRFFTSQDDLYWNLADLVIVLSGVFDQWGLRLWCFFASGGDSNSSFGKMMTLARTLRLMRILRLVRVVKAVRPLHDLAVVLVKAMQSMFWVLVLTFVALYAMAILTTRMLGRGLSADFPDETRQMFTSIPESMFTLFAIMNGQDFALLEPLLEEIPWLKPLFVVFTIYCSWALLSVMTGVVSEHMQAIREAQEAKDLAEAEGVRSECTKVLTEVFSAADLDGNGTLCKAEFMNFAASPHQQRRMQAVGVPALELAKVFHCLDIDESGSVDLWELVQILEWLSEPVTGRQIIRVNSSVKYQAAKAQKQIDTTSKSVESFSNLQKAHTADMLKSLGEIFGSEAEAASEAVNRECAQQAPVAPVAPPPVRSRTSWAFRSYRALSRESLDTNSSSLNTAQGSSRQHPMCRSGTACSLGSGRSFPSTSSLGTRGTWARTSTPPP